MFSSFRAFSEYAGLQSAGEIFHPGSGPNVKCSHCCLVGSTKPK